LYPDDVRNFHFTLLVDVHTGKARQALDRARVDYPGFNDLDGLEINAENIWRITEYSWILIEAGEEETAKPLLERALDYLRTACGQGEEPGVTEYPCDHKYIVHALLGQKEQVLAELQRMIEVEQIRFMMDGFFRIDRFPFDGLGSLRDDPEIKRLMKIVDDHFAAQLESLRQMQKDGEAL
jgi:hypothetical protein